MSEQWSGDTLAALDEADDDFVVAHIESLDASAELEDLQAVRRRLLDQALTSPGLRVVELGPGVGPIALEIAQRVPEGRVLAVDNSKRMLQQLEHRGRAAGLTNIDYVHADARDTGLPAGGHDVVAAFDLASHIGPTAALMAEAKRLLRPGGTLLMTQGGPPLALVPNAHVLTAFSSAVLDSHLAPAVGARFGEHARAAGFREVQTRGELVYTSKLSTPQWWYFVQSAASFFPALELLEPDETEAWVEQLQEADEQGQCVMGFSVFTLQAKAPGITLRRR